MSSRPTRGRGSRGPRRQRGGRQPFGAPPRGAPIYRITTVPGSNPTIQQTGTSGATQTSNVLRRPRGRPPDRGIRGTRETGRPPVGPPPGSTIVTSIPQNTLTVNPPIRRQSNVTRGTPTI